MCTCITFKTKDHYFGRNLDLEYRFNEKVVITPRNYEFFLKAGGSFRTKYAMIGIATIMDSYPLYAEATNEKGLSIAGLNFPENAYYGKKQKDKINLTPFELIPWILGNFASVEELETVIRHIYLIDQSFSKNVPLTSLHYMICDAKHCLVLEQTRDGMHIYSNSIGVLTNNPPFSYHLININNYLNLTSEISRNRFSNKIKLNAYGLGMGAIGLPGDNSPSSRFVRAAFNKLNSVCDANEESSLSQFFHILDTVAVVKGTTMSPDGKWHITVYSCCCNTTKGIFYYKTYSNNQITAIKMTEENKSRNGLTIFNLEEKQQIHYAN